VLVLVLISFTSGLAQTKAGGSTAVQQIQTQRLADLGVVAIRAQHCACELQGVDAVYFNKIIVEVSADIRFRVVDSDVVGNLKVTYFNLLIGRTETKNVMLEARLFRGGVHAFVEVVSGPILVKKSVGITAEVTPAGLTTGDPQPTNNKKTETNCNVRLL
jgi:hypothetical protein